MAAPAFAMKKRSMPVLKSRNTRLVGRSPMSHPTNTHVAHTRMFRPPHPSQGGYGPEMYILVVFGEVVGVGVGAVLEEQRMPSCTTCVPFTEPEKILSWT